MSYVPAAIPAGLVASYGNSRMVNGRVLRREVIRYRRSVPSATFAADAVMVAGEANGVVPNVVVFTDVSTKAAVRELPIAIRPTIPMKPNVGRLEVFKSPNGHGADLVNNLENSKPIMDNIQLPPR